MALVESIPVNLGSDWHRCVINFAPDKVVSDDELFEMAQKNEHLRFERNSQGEVEVMVPTGWDRGRQNSKITGQLVAWAEVDGTGETADSSGGYVLSNGAIRSPDASWIRNEKLKVIPAEHRLKLLPACPDFVVELRSETDSLQHLQAKMSGYLSCGAQLGWLINPQEKKVHVYRPGAAVEVLDNPETLSGEQVLRNFVLDLRKVW